MAIICIKINYPRTWDLLCVSFGNLFTCPKIVKLNYINQKLSKIDENLVYGNIKQQQVMVNIYSAVLEVREDLMQEESSTSLSSRGPTAPSSG